MCLCGCLILSPARALPQLSFWVPINKDWEGNGRVEPMSVCWCVHWTNGMSYTMCTCHTSATCLIAPFLERMHTCVGCNYAHPGAKPARLDFKQTHIKPRMICFWISRAAMVTDPATYICMNVRAYCMSGSHGCRHRPCFSFVCLFIFEWAQVGVWCVKKWLQSWTASQMSPD